MEVGLKLASFYKKLYIHKAHFCNCSIWMFIIDCLLLICSFTVITLTVATQKT